MVDHAYQYQVAAFDVFVVQASLDIFVAFLLVLFVVLLVKINSPLF